MLSAALYFVAALVVSASGACQRSVSCPCGTSGQTYTYCSDGLVIRGDPCDRWSECQTCREGYPYCVTCPSGRFGGLCITVSVRKSRRKKRQYTPVRSSDLERRSQSSSAQSRNRITCTHPGIDENAEVVESLLDERGGTFVIGTSFHYKCKKEYKLLGNAIIYCLSTGLWSHEHPTCELRRPVDNPVDESEIRCVPQDDVLHSRVYRKPTGGQLTRVGQPSSLETEDTVGTILQYECKEGYVMKGTDSVVCNRNGFWSSGPPECVEVGSREGIPSDIECVPQDPREFRNGRVYSTVDSVNPAVELTPENSEETPNPVGTQLQFVCDPGYTMVGQEYAICQPEGFWSADPPACVQESPSESLIECVPIDLIDNGNVYRIVGRGERELITEDSIDMEFPVGTLLQYTCNIGYILNGVRDVFCEPNGLWSPAESPTCIEDCGHVVVEPSPKITNGNATVAGEWPWMVSISALNSNNFPVMICGGALLDKRTVLTAAHCFTRDGPPYVLHFGKYYRKNSKNDGGVVTRTISRVINHPQFNPKTLANDIALIRLESDLEYTERILPVCIPTPVSSVTNLVSQKKGIVTGWGLNENSLRSDELMMAHIPVQTPQTCMNSFSAQGLQFRMGPGMFCAGYPEGFVSACRGDSGSPFVFIDYRTQRYTTEGIVSFSVEGQCGRPGNFVVFTKVSNFLDWIDRNRRRRRRP